MIVESYEDVVRISGALRENYWDTLHTAISLVLKRYPAGVIIEGSGITEITPSGADTFRSVMEFIHRHEARVIVTALPDHILVVVRSVPDVRSQLPIATSVEAARKSLNLLIEDEAVRKKRKQPGERARRMLVCLTGDASDQEILRYTVKLAEALEAVAVLFYAIRVPRDLPLTAPLAEEEARAERVIEVARKMLDGRGVITDCRIDRGRDLASSLAEALEDIAADPVLIGLPLTDDGTDAAGKLVKSVNAKVTAPVIFLRGRLPAH